MFDSAQPIQRPQPVSTESLMARLDVVVKEKREASEQIAQAQEKVQKLLEEEGALLRELSHERHGGLTEWVPEPGWNSGGGARPRSARST